jgi:hypothetical protein
MDEAIAICHGNQGPKPAVNSAEKNILRAPSNRPIKGPRTREAMMSANHIGSIPIEPKPMGLNEAISAVEIPRNAISL